MRTAFASVALLALACLLAAPSDARAQTIAGTLVAPDGRGVEGALVSLVAEDGTLVVQRLTSSSGRFLLRARAPGEYRVRAERIGYRTSEGPPVRLEADETVPYRLEASEAAITLEGIEVESEARCVRDPRTGAQVATLWEEARKALTTARVAEESSLFRFDVGISVRDVRGGEVVGVTRTGRQVLTEVPLASEAVDTLLTRGFVWFEDEGQLVYHAPDAEVLLSDPFLEEHCFRPRAGGEARPGQVGLSFEPVRGREAPDVAGTFWFDLQSSELRDIEFRWVHLPWPGLDRDATGRVEFGRAPNGAWFVERATLRMPTVIEPDGAAYRAVRFREKVFEVRQIAGPGRSEPDEAPAAAIAGTVTDGLLGGALADAVVYLSGTDRETRTDEEGRFRLEGLRPGLYTVAVVHPWLDRLGVPGRPLRIEVGPGAEAWADLTTRGAEALERVCPEELPTDEQRGLVLGTALLPPGADTPPATEIRVEWPEGTGTERVRLPSRVDESGTAVRVGWPEGAADRRVLGIRLDGSSGPHFVVCGVPRDVEVRLGPEGGAPTATVRLPREGPAAVEVDVPLAGGA